MEETLEAGLARLFGGGAAPAPTTAERSAAAPSSDRRAVNLIRQAVELYQSAVAAQRAGNWAEYGQEHARLGELLRQLQSVLGGREP